MQHEAFGIFLLIRLSLQSPKLKRVGTDAGVLSSPAPHEGPHGPALPGTQAARLIYLFVGQNKAPGPGPRALCTRPWGSENWAIRALRTRGLEASVSSTNLALALCAFDAGVPGGGVHTDPQTHTDTWTHTQSWGPVQERPSPHPSGSCLHTQREGLPRLHRALPRVAMWEFIVPLRKESQDEKSLTQKLPLELMNSGCQQVKYGHISSLADPGAPPSRCLPVLASPPDLDRFKDVNVEDTLIRNAPCPLPS